MNKNSIKTKLLIFVMASTVISFMILGFYNASNNYSSEYNLLKQKELNLAKSTSKFINSYLQSKIDIITAVAKEVNPLQLNIENNQIVEKLRLGKISGNFASLYIGFKNNGNYLRYDGVQRKPARDNYDSRVRPWFKEALKLDAPVISKPYIDFTSKKLVISISAPVKVNGENVAVVSSDIFIDTIVQSVLNIQLNNMGTAYLIDGQESIIIHNNKELLKSKDSLFSQVKTIKEDGFGEALEKGMNKLISYSTIKTSNWKIIIKLDKNMAFKEVNNQVFKEIILYIILLLVMLSFILFFLIKILSPLQTLEEGFNYFFKYLKAEENNIRTINITTNDEFGNMAKIINKEMQVIANNIEEDKVLINNVKEIVSQVNQGKFDVSVEKTTSNKSLNELRDILNHMIKTINRNVNKDINPILNKLEEYSTLNFVNNIPNANGNIAVGLNDLSNIINKMLQENKKNGLHLDESSKVLLNNVNILNKASNETAVSLEETAAALEEITSTVVSNTDRISTMSSYSTELSSSIKEGQKLATYTVESMDSINQQTQSIADAITVIDQIAFQTNILSLNAAVEAATAGEAGKGFAVVAQEVRNLASRSAEAAREIKDLVASAANKTNNGKKIADDMINGYVKLEENIAKTTNLIYDISSSSIEQKTGIEQINDVVTKLDGQTQNNASVANQTYDIAINTADIAKKILENVNEKKFRDS